MAYKTGRVNQLPVKEKMLKKKHRWLYYFLMEHEGKILVHKREGKDIWQNLHEFYLLETEEQIKWNNELVQEWLHEQFDISKPDIQFISTLQKQLLTHQVIKGQFIQVKLTTIPKSLQHYQWLHDDEIAKLAFPKFITQFLEMESLQGNLF